MNLVHNAQEDPVDNSSTIQLVKPEVETPAETMVTVTTTSDDAQRIGNQKTQPRSYTTSGGFD